MSKSQKRRVERQSNHESVFCKNCQAELDTGQFDKPYSVEVGIRGESKTLVARVFQNTDHRPHTWIAVAKHPRFSTLKIITDGWYYKEKAVEELELICRVLGLNLTWDLAGGEMKDT